jgi:tRNA(Ile)-lysidine synthase
MKNKTISRSTFIKRIVDTVKHYDMLKSGDRILIGVSGGPDSVCLVKVLAEVRRKLGVELVVANLDHGIRGKESERDSNFVKSLAREMDLEFVYKKVNLSKVSKSKNSLEERAREKRYKFFLKEAKKTKCTVIATGHNLDDQAETVLMRVVSGVSFKGLTGIPPVREEGSIRIVRPLIRTEKKDILDFLKKEKIFYVVDSSNLKEDYLRNSIRLKVIPFLEKYNPRIKRSLVNLSDTLREDYTYLDSLRPPKEKNIKNEKACTSVLISDIILQPQAVKKDIFKEALKRSGGEVKKLTYRHWMDVDLLLRSGVKGKSLDLPGDIRVTRTQKALEFKKRQI